MDRQDYAKSQYSDQARLQVRVSIHERFTQPRVAFIPWVLDQIEWRGQEWVLDVGAGTGLYAPETIKRSALYIAADRFPGMLCDLASTLLRVNLDAVDLPFSAESFDVVLANHMLYYVSDRDQACSEFARVLRPGGWLIAATNSADYLDELHKTHCLVAARFGYDHKLDRLAETRGFTLENGRTVLKRHFSRVDRHVLKHYLVFPRASPVIDYLASFGDRLLDLLPSSVTWNDVAAELTVEIEKQIAKDGAFRASKLSGVFLCQLM